jgi:hypothetical protein
MALPGLFPIYPDPIPMLYQVSLSLPMPEPSKIALSVGITSSNPFLVPNVDFLQSFIKGDIGITDKMMKEAMFKNFNHPIAQGNEKVFKKFAQLNDFNLPDISKYKKDGKIKLPKEDVNLPPMDGIGFKGFEKTMLTSMFETQKPYFEVAKLVIGNIAKIEDIIARVMPLLGVPLSTKSLKPVGNIGVQDGRPKAIGYQNAKEIKVALAKLQEFSKSGSRVKIDKYGNAERIKDPVGPTASTAGPGSNQDANGNKTWEVVSTVYSTGVFKPDIEYKYIYIDLPPEKEKPEEVTDLNLEDDDPYNKYKPERIILGIFRSDGTPLNPNEILKTVGLDSNYNLTYVNTPFKRADWITRSKKWHMDNLYPNNEITLAEPVRNVWPSLGSPTFTWERYAGVDKQNSKTKPNHNAPGQEWQLKKYKKGDKNLINKEDAIEGSPVIVSFDSTDTDSHKSFFTDIVKYKMYQQEEVADFSTEPKIHTERPEKDKIADIIINNFNVPSHVQNVYLYGQAKASVYKEVNGKPAFPDLMRMSFKPFRFYSNDAKSDDKITEYNKTQNIPAGYIWIDPEADYETKIIRIDPSTNIEFEEAKGEAEIKSNIKSFIKNKARFSISTNEKFNFEIRKNDQQVESFTDIDEYVLENWNYNSNVGLAPEKRIENNNKYNISAWSKIPVRKYKNVKGRIVLKREIIGGNKIQDFLNGENNLLLIHELVNQGGKYYYRKYKWVMSSTQVIVMGLLSIVAPGLLLEMVALYEINPEAHWKFELNVGDFIDKIDDLLKHASDAFSQKHTIEFSIPWPGGEKDYKWTYSIKEMLDKIYDILPIGDNDALEAINHALRSPIVKLLHEIKFSYDFRLKDFFPHKVYIPINNGVQFLNDDWLGSKSKTRIYLENGEVKKWYYVYDRTLFGSALNLPNLNDTLPTFGKDKKIIINYDSDPEKDGANEGDINIISSSLDIPLYKIKAENTNFPYGKIIDPSKITNDALTKDELFSTGKYGAGGSENPQEIEVIKRYMLTDLDTESYYVIEGVLVDKNKQTEDVKAGAGAGGPGGGYYKLPHAIGAAKVFLSFVVDIVTKLIPQIVKLISLFTNPAKFVVEILKEKMGEGFSIFSKDSFKAFESAKKEKDKMKDKKPSERSRNVKDIFKNSPISNHVFVNKKGDYKFLLDGLALLPFSIFGKDLPFGMDMNFDKLPDGVPINLIFKESLDKAKVKNIQDFLKPKIKDFKGTGANGLAGGLNLSELKSFKDDPLYKSTKDKGKINPNDNFDILDIKYSTGSFINGVNYNYVYVSEDTEKLLNEANNILQTPDESVNLENAQKKLDELDNALKKDLNNKALKDMIGKLKAKFRGLNDNSQPLLKMLLGFVTLPIKIIGGIIKWLMDFFKGLTNPLTLPAKIVELLSFSWLMKFFTPLGILELAGVKFEPKKLAEWCALVHVPNPKPPNVAPKIPDGFNLPTDLPYKDASPKGKFLIPDDYELVDLNQVISMPFMPKLPTYTARQYRENCVRPVKLVVPFLCLFEKVINGIIDFIWSTLGIEALIPAPHIKLCSKSPDPDISDLVKIKKDLEKDSSEPTKDTGNTNKDNDVPTDAGFLYDITLDNGTVVKGLNYDELQKYIKVHEDIGYDFKF